MQLRQRQCHTDEGAEAREWRCASCSQVQHQLQIRELCWLHQTNMSS